MSFSRWVLLIMCIFLLTSCGMMENGATDVGGTTETTEALGSVFDAVIPKKYPQTMNGWSFQYNDGTDDYSLFFALLDKDENPMSCKVDVDIRIVSDNGEELYKGKKTVSEDDYGTYTSEAKGDRYLANVRIPAKEVKQGTTLSGTVYFTVSNDGSVWFDEVSCQASYCLPVKGVEVVAEDLPVSVDVKDYSGKVESTIQINDISYKYDTDYILRLTITVIGEKTYGTSQSMYDKLNYKLYDHEGYVVESGHLFLNSLSKGDKFKDDSIVLYDVIPGEKYTVKFSEYEY